MDGREEQERERPRNVERESWRKVYEPAESFLTRYRKEGNPFAEGLFNLGTVHIALVPITLVARELYAPGSYERHINGLHYLLGGPWVWLMTFFVFSLEFIVSFAVYFCFLGWAACYRRVGKAANALFLLLLVVFIVVYRYWLLNYMFYIKISPGLRFGCCVQQLVLVFKWISFIYENGYKVQYPWHKEDETGPAVWYGGQMEPQVGSFSSYLYFLFCPVLLYRDRYPRKPPNYRKAFTYFLQFVAFVWIIYVLLLEVGMPLTMHRQEILRVVVQNLFFGFLVLTCAHTFQLHCWANCWSELLGFADCAFYGDWWNAESLQNFLRSWNPIVHDWLKAYMQPTLKKLVPQPLATMVIIVMSAFEHDFLFSTGIGYFIPLYMVEYGICGVLLIFKPKMSRWVDQIIMCIGLSVGMGIQMTLVCTEAAALIHCPEQRDAYWLHGLQTVDCYKRFNY